MRNRINKVATLLFAVVATVAVESNAAVNPPPQVVPAVQQWTGGEGTLSVRDSAIVIDDESMYQRFLPNMLQTDLEAIGCGHREIHKAKTTAAGDIILRYLSSDSPEVKNLGPNGYTISISDRVTITAAVRIEKGPEVNGIKSTAFHSGAGLFYGTRTLLQMLAQNPKAATLPKGTIVDYPQYRHRMLLLDVGRKPFPIAVLKDYLRIMAWYKMNELQLHLSDEAFGDQYTGFRVQCDTYPGLASKDCFYTKKELRDLQDMAEQMGITITPEFEMPGHARVLTDYWPDLRLKGYPSYLDVSNPQTIEHLKKLLDEMIPIFDAPDFHIGTDEYRVDGPRQAELHEAFRKFINTMNAHVRSKGKNCRIWSGFEYMKGKTEIDPSVIIDMWETRDAKSQIAKGHSIINSSDGRTYIVPGAHYYGVNNAGIYNSWEPWMVSDDPKMNPAKDDPKLLGGKLHVWNDQGPTGYTMNEIARLAFPSIQVFAEKLWGTKGSKDYAEFQKRAEVVRSTGFSRNADELPPEGGTTSAVIPGVTVFQRIEAKHDHLVIDVPAEQILTMQVHSVQVGGAVMLASDQRTVPLGFEGRSRENLEYPWSLSVDVFKTEEPGGRGVILSSDLAEICSDYSRRDEKAKQVRRGIGVIRAAGSPGSDAASSHLANDVSRVYSDPLPLKHWTTITIVGQQRQTTVYINGVKAGESGEQTLCPLARVGMTLGRTDGIFTQKSFVGKVRNLKVWDRALTAKEISRAAGSEVSKPKK